MRNGSCPICQVQVQVTDDAMEGEIVQCPDCGADLEYKGMNSEKAVLEEAATEAEDWGE